MKSLFKNPEYQKELNEKGYVLIDFANAQEIETLLNIHTEKSKKYEGDYGFHVSLDDADKENVKQLSNGIKSVLQPLVDAQFENPKIFTASFVIKEPGLQNIVPPHQDWSFTDESNYYSLTVWTPLVDVNLENGALGVIDGSHRFFSHPRSSPSPQSKSPLSDHAFTLFPYMKVIPMKVGQALVFDNRTIHASPPNTTDKPRIAAGIGVTFAEAPLRHYYQIPESAEEKLNVYEVDTDFFTFYDNKTLGQLFDSGKQLESCKLAETITREVPLLSKKEMEALVLEVPTNKWQQELVDSLSKLYKDYITPKENIKQEKNNSMEQQTTTTTNTEKKEWKDTRTFFEKYTIKNIIAEIKWRLTGKA